MCPICLEGDAKHEEHLPQKDLGGAVMTMTCSRCNNDLGSRAELDLQQWFDHDGNVPGRRRMPPPYYPETADVSSFALVVHQKLRPEIMEMLASGEWRMHYRQPDPGATGWLCSSTPTSPHASTCTACLTALMLVPYARIYLPPEIHREGSSHRKALELSVSASIDPTPAHRGLHSLW